jgi:hypothetical protein
MQWGKCRADRISSHDASWYVKLVLAQKKKRNATVQ